VKRRCLDSVLDGPLDRALEHGPIVTIHAKDETAVDHYAEVMQTTDCRRVIATQVLILPLLSEIRRVERFEPDEETS